MVVVGKHFTCLLVQRLKSNHLTAKIVFVAPLPMSSKLGVDSFSILFKHPSFQRPIA